MPGFSIHLLKSTGSTPSEPTEPSPLHADTVSFVNRMTAAGDTPSEAKIALIDTFVKGCYSNGLRDSTTPDNSLIQDSLLPIVATKAAGAVVKLWSKSSVASSATNLNFVDSDANLGLKGSSGKRIDSGWNVATHTDFADCHLAFFASEIGSGVFCGANEGGSEFTFYYLFDIFRFLATRTDSSQFVDCTPNTSPAFLLGSCTALNDSVLYRNGVAIGSNLNNRINVKPNTNFIWFNRTDLYQASTMRGKYLALGRGIPSDLQGTYNSLVSSLVAGIEAL